MQGKKKRKEKKEKQSKTRTKSLQYANSQIRLSVPAATTPHLLVSPFPASFCSVPSENPSKTPKFPIPSIPIPSPKISNPESNPSCAHPPHVELNRSNFETSSILSDLTYPIYSPKIQKIFRHPQSALQIPPACAPFAP